LTNGHQRNGLRSWESNGQSRISKIKIRKVPAKYVLALPRPKKELKHSAKKGAVSAATNKDISSMNVQEEHFLLLLHVRRTSRTRTPVQVTYAQEE
jgi:hypothetical protein